MPWKESHRVNERMRFVTRLDAGERMTDLCREYEISRKTGYKFLERYRRLGPSGLFDVSRRPIRTRSRVSEDVRRIIVHLKQEKPTWGPDKLRFRLRKKHPGLPIPSRSTIHRLLEIQGLVKKRKRQKGWYRDLEGTSIPPSHCANERWCVDFKGQFRLGDQSYCYPLTISDHFSRYLLTCEALDSTLAQPARAVFEQAFHEYGIPDAILSDNGVPFGSVGLFGWSSLSVWWVRLGIRIDRIRPGHPEENGRHERMHLTLKQDTTRPPAKGMLQQQEKFDRFRQEFNFERPHQALAMATPSELYQYSKRQLPKQLPELRYPLHDEIRIVQKSGAVQLGRDGRKQISLFLGQAFIGQHVGLREEEDDLWRVSFAHFDLGNFDRRTGQFEPFESPVRYTN